MLVRAVVALAGSSLFLAAAARAEAPPEFNFQRAWSSGTVAGRAVGHL
jgi:hypothetical protein